jgi:hypothetical protein
MLKTEKNLTDVDILEMTESSTSYIREESGNFLVPESRPRKSKPALVASTPIRSSPFSNTSSRSSGGSPRLRAFDGIAWQRSPRLGYTYVNSPTYRNAWTPEREVPMPHMARKPLDQYNDGEVSFRVSKMDLGRHIQEFSDDSETEIDIIKDDRETAQVNLKLVLLLLWQTIFTILSVSKRFSVAFVSLTTSLLWSISSSTSSIITLLVSVSSIARSKISSYLSTTAWPFSHNFILKEKIVPSSQQDAFSDAEPVVVSQSGNFNNNMAFKISSLFSAWVNAILVLPVALLPLLVPSVVTNLASEVEAEDKAQDKLQFDDRNIIEDQDEEIITVIKRVTRYFHDIYIWTSKKASKPLQKLNSEVISQRRRRQEANTPQQVVNLVEISVDVDEEITFVRRIIRQFHEIYNWTQRKVARTASGGIFIASKLCSRSTRAALTLPNTIVLLLVPSILTNLSADAVSFDGLAAPGSNFKGPLIIEEITLLKTITRNVVFDTNF